MKPKKTLNSIFSEEGTSRHASFSKKEKLRGVKLVLKKGYTPQQAAQKIGCPAESVERWVKSYRNRRQSARPLRTNLSISDWLNREETLFSEKTRIKAVKLHLLKGYPRGRVAQKVGCSAAELSEWIEELGPRVKARKQKQPGPRTGKTRARLTEEEKKEAVRRTLFEGASLYQVAHETGVSFGAVKGWAGRYTEQLKAENSQLANPLPEKPHVKNTEEKKKEAVKRVLFEGAATYRVSQELGVAFTTVKNWIARYAEQVKAENPGIPLAVPQEPRGSHPVQERIRAVEMILYEGLSYGEAANRFGCSQATVFNWLRAYREQVTAANPGRKLNRYKNVRNTVPRKARTSQEKNAGSRRTAKPQRKPSVTAEVRMQTAKRVLFEGCTPARAAAEVGRSAQSILLWVHKYEAALKEMYPDLPVNDGRGKEARRKERLFLERATAAARPKRVKNETLTGISALFQEPEFDKAARLKAVHAVVVGGLTPEDVAERISAKTGDVNAWVQQLGGRIRKKPADSAGRNRRTDRYRRSAVYKILFEQYPLKKAAEKLGCPAARMRRWVLEEYRYLREAHPRKFEQITWQPKPKKTVSKKAKTVPPEEKAFLQESQGVLEADIKTKFGFIKEKSGTYAVPMMCRRLGVDESTYEQWNNTPAKNLAVGRDSLAEKVKEINASMGGKANAQQIWKALGEQGILCGIGQVYEICKELGIRSSLLPPK